MANATKDLTITRWAAFAAGFRNIQPVGDGVTLFKGIMVAQDAADGGIERVKTAAAPPVVGVTLHGVQVAPVATGDLRVEIEHDRVFIFNNDGGDPITEANTLLGAQIFADDDNTVSATNQAAANPVAGRFYGLEDDGRVRVFIGLQTDV